MTRVSRSARIGRQVISGRRRADAVATRLGIGLRDVRRSTAMTQREAAARAGLSQVRFSELERGLGANASLETWACAAAAVGEQLVGFLEAAPGASPPRDMEHLRRQASLIAVAQRGAWHALPELALDPRVVRSRSADVALVRWERREAILAEIWDWFDDVGASLRSLDGKRDALAARLARESGEQWDVRCLFVVRRTRRNKRLLAELGPLFAARFRGSARAWIEALTDKAATPPQGDGLLWSSSNPALQPSRL